MFKKVKKRTNIRPVDQEVEVVEEVVQPVELPTVTEIKEQSQDIEMEGSDYSQEVIEKREVVPTKSKFRKGLKIGTTSVSREIQKPTHPIATVNVDDLPLQTEEVQAEKLSKLQYLA